MVSMFDGRHVRCRLLIHVCLMLGGTLCCDLCVFEGVYVCVELAMTIYRQCLNRQYKQGN
jgi:hypothetical protein